MEFINQVMNKKALNNLLAQVYLEYGGSKAASLANSLKRSKTKTLKRNKKYKKGKENVTLQFTYKNKRRICPQ